MEETKGKFYDLKVDEREFDRKDTNTLGESQRKWEELWEIKAVSHLNKEKVRETDFFPGIWEKVRENERN